MKLSPDVLALNPEMSAHKVTLAHPVDTGNAYKSALEKLCADEWIWQQKVAGIVLAAWYEPMSFNLPGGRYTPDFFLIRWDFVKHAQELVIVEVKGWTKSLRADHRAFMEAANTHRWARWCWLTWDKKNGWKEEWA